METWTIPLSGQFLIAHLATYGLGSLLATGGEEALVGHHPVSLEMEPQVTTSASVGRAVELIRNSASECEAFVQADLDPAKTRPIIWARATDVRRAVETLPERELLLDRAEKDDARAAAGLLAGLGVPAAWSVDDPPRPQKGASQLDVVMHNIHSDFVRGVLRRTCPKVASGGSDDLAAAWMRPVQHQVPTDGDKTGWSPPGTRVNAVHQWLAALGLGLLPVAQSASGHGLTPCCWQDGRGVTVPVFRGAVSVPRLRCLLQRPELQVPRARLSASEAGRLLAFGIREVVTFARKQSTGQSIAYTFARGERVGL